MLESVQNGSLGYEKMSPEEMKAKGILGRLIGPCCDTIHPTRNGRLYSEKLWEQVFDNPIMQEKIKCGVCYGELGHPADRTEIDMEKVAICLREQPKKNKDGKLEAVFDILDTPCGRILKTLCDYGSILGVSSRGTGDVIDNGECEEVEPDTYECECFDIVTVPAVKEARMKYVTESLNNKTLNQALRESLSNSNDNEKKAIKEALNECGIDCYNDITLPSSDNGVTINENVKSVAAHSEGAVSIKDFQELLRKNRELEKATSRLQEKLSVCYTKESNQEAHIAKLKSDVNMLSEMKQKVDALTKRNSMLSEKLEEKENCLKKIEQDKKSSEKDNQRVVKGLSESISKKNSEIKSLNERVTSLTESKVSALSESDNKVKSLKEEIERIKKDSADKISNYTTKLNNQTKLTEKYKTIAKMTVNRYIDDKALSLGIKPEDIKCRLPEGYSFNDINKVCEDLQSYRVSVNKLPFEISRKDKIRMTVTESKNEPLLAVNGVVDDEIDKSLKELAGI